MGWLRMDGWVDGGMYEWVGGGMDEWMMDGWMNG